MDKGKRGGIVGDLISGTGGLIVLTIVILVIVSTLLGANLLRETATTTTATELGAGLNSSAGVYTFTNFSTGVDRSLAVTLVTNGTQTLTTTEYLLDTTLGTITNNSALTWNDVNVTITFIKPTTYEDSSDGMAGNLTSGIDNVSAKIPTILLIAAVVLLFGVITLLVRQSQAMGIGGKGGASL